MSNLTQLAAPAGRMLLALIFILSGYGKIAGYAGTAAYMAKFGVPGSLLPLVIAVELIGGVLLALGLWSRLAAFALAGFTLLAAIFFHNEFSDRIQYLMFMKNLAIAGGLLMVVANGPGAYALDNRRALREPVRA